MTEKEIRETFRYHEPDTVKVEVFDGIRARMTEMVVATAAVLPPSRERSLFITLCQQAQMMANAAIAIHGTVDNGGESE